MGGSAKTFRKIALRTPQSAAKYATIYQLLQLSFIVGKILIYTAKVFCRSSRFLGLDQFDDFHAALVVS